MDYQSTMNLGTVVALPLEMHCKQIGRDIACSENNELICVGLMQTLKIKCMKNDPYKLVVKS